MCVCNVVYKLQLKIMAFNNEEKVNKLWKKAHIKSNIESVIENAFNKRSLAFYANEVRSHIFNLITRLCPSKLEVNYERYTCKRILFDIEIIGSHIHCRQNNKFCSLDNER